MHNFVYINTVVVSYLLVITISAGIKQNFVFLSIRIFQLHSYFLLVSRIHDVLPAGAVVVIVISDACDVIVIVARGRVAVGKL